MATATSTKELPIATTNNVSSSSNNLKLYGRVILSLENCLLPKERLDSAPSAQDGLDKEAEMDLRILGCEMIQTAGILLRLPQVAMATGQVLFHRFFYSKSFVKYNYEVVAMGCVCLASKIEEAPRRIRDVINVFNHIKQVRNNRTIQPVILDQAYINLKNQVIKAERRVLKELGFCVHVKHPHKIIVMYLQVLECKNNQQLTQLSWNYMNDSLRTDVFLRYSPETIACACIYLSARQLKIPLPNKPKWFQIFNVEEDDIRDISYIILRLYCRPKPNVDKLEKTVEELKKAQEEAKLKARGLSASNTPQPTGGFSPNSRSNSPNKNDKSPTIEVKKEKTHENSKVKVVHSEVSNAKHDKDTNHAKNHSPVSNTSGGHKSVSHSSRSHTRSPTPKRKGRTPPRGYKDARKSASRSRSRSKSTEHKKHRVAKRRRSRSRSHSYIHSPPHRNHKKTHKEKPRYRSRSRERIYRSRSRSYDKYTKSRKERTRDNGHHRSHSRDRSRR